MAKAAKPKLAKVTTHQGHQIKAVAMRKTRTHGTAKRGRTLRVKNGWLPPGMG